MPEDPNVNKPEEDVGEKRQPLGCLLLKGINNYCIQELMPVGNKSNPLWFGWMLVGLGVISLSISIVKLL